MRSRLGKKRENSFEFPFSNFSLTFAKALLIVLTAIIALIATDTKKSDGTKPKIDAMISIEWPGSFHDDVDLWVGSPYGIVYYHNREAGSVFLERDDYGDNCKNVNVTVDAGKEQPDGTCEEVVALRGLTPGDYVVNVHLYKSQGLSSGPAVPVTVAAKIEQLNPGVSILWRGSAVLDTVKQEVHLVRFTITEDGHVGQFDSDRPASLRDGIGDGHGP